MAFYDVFQIIILFLYVLMLVNGIINSIIALGILFRLRNNLSTSYHWFCALCVNDILFLLLGINMAIQMASHDRYYNYVNQILLGCSLLFTLGYLFIWCNLYFLAALSIERVIYFLFPFKVKTILTTKNKVIAMCIIIIYCVGFITFIAIFLTAPSTHIKFDDRNKNITHIVYSCDYSVKYFRKPISKLIDKSLKFINMAIPAFIILISTFYVIKVIVVTRQSIKRQQKQQQQYGKYKSFDWSSSRSSTAKDDVGNDDADANNGDKYNKQTNGNNIIRIKKRLHVKSGIIVIIMNITTLIITALIYTAYIITSDNLDQMTGFYIKFVFLLNFQHWCFLLIYFDKHRQQYKRFWLRIICCSKKA